jgi:hypothetical protein
VIRVLLSKVHADVADSLASSQIYEVIKTIYSSPESTNSAPARVAVLQNTLGQLRLANIATLDAITTHFTRLIELTSADDAYITLLAQNLAHCFLRPRAENPLTMQERHGQRLVRDLFEHKEEIFGELKRASAATNNRDSSARGRPQGISSDEHNRRANMEARNKAIASRSRATSPAPVSIEAANAGGRHRRDRSVGDPHKRFPVVASPTINRDHHRRGRYSLEVPDSDPNTPQSTAQTHLDPSVDQVVPRSTPARSDTNGSSDLAHLAASPPVVDPPAKANVEETAEGGGMEKKNSLARHSATAHKVQRKGPGSGSGSGLGLLSRTSKAGNRESVGSVPDSKGSDGESSQGVTREGSQRASYGVQLEDKPMDF